VRVRFLYNTTIQDSRRLEEIKVLGFFLGFFILAIIIFMLVFPAKGKYLSERINFFSKGKDLGFSAAECRLLFQLAKKTKIAHPGALFWSKVQLNGCIRIFADELLKSNKFDEDENQDFLFKLFKLLKRIEAEQKAKQQGIKNTREIEVLTHVHIVKEGAGSSRSKIIENSTAFLKIERPNGSALPINFQWTDKQISVYFNRKDDAQYCFESKVIAEHLPSINGSSEGSLDIMHCDKIDRTQYRASMRATTNCSVFLYPIASETAGMEVIPHVKCILENISDTGAAVLSGGQTSAGAKIVLQISLLKTVNISGTIRSVEYNEKKNTSRLHIHFDIMKPNVYNIVMLYVLGIIKDSQDGEAVQAPAEPETEIQMTDDFTEPQKEAPARWEWEE
jgi:c-di-GMP-binding flagellar brake protein YcgR